MSFRAIALSKASTLELTLERKTALLQVAAGSLTRLSGPTIPSDQA